MKKVSLLSKVALVAVLSCAGLGTASVAVAGHGGCHKNNNPICPQIFDPVTCDNGKTYTNSCYALADCATGCVPSGTVAQ